MKKLCVIVLPICSLFLFLLLLEVLFRIITPAEKVVDKKWFEDNVKLNSQGFRDKEYSLKKADDIFRIVILGDSQTFGYGVDKVEDTFPKKLESYLNEGLPSPRFEVLNVSAPGWNTDTQLYRLYGSGFDYKPDLVLLAFYLNDIQTPMFFDCNDNDIDILPRGKAVNVMRNLQLYGFFKAWINRLLERLGKKPTYADCINQLYASRGWKMEEVFLDTIVMSSRLKNIHFMLAVIPVMHKLKDGYPFTRPHEKLAGYCSERQIHCLDLYERAFKGMDETELTVSSVDPHLNEKGAAVVAKVLYENLWRLKTYRHLRQIRGAFDLAELVAGSALAMDVDGGLPEIGDGPPPFEICPQ